MDPPGGSCLDGYSGRSWTAGVGTYQALTALDHHRWYRERFADYPAERRALIPYLL